MFPLCPCRQSSLLWMRPEKDELASSLLTGCLPSRRLTSSRSCLVALSLKKAPMMTSWPRKVPIINWYRRALLSAKGPQLCERAEFYGLLCSFWGCSEAPSNTHYNSHDIFISCVDQKFWVLSFPGFSTDDSEC